MAKWPATPLPTSPPFRSSTASSSSTPGQHARGTFAIPATIAAFPRGLVAEAVGQLAAWVAMDADRFSRPAGRGAGHRDALSAATPRRGKRSTLDVDILECDDDAVAYNGRASDWRQQVIELVDCLGPMLPVAEFDSPEALRERLRAAARRRRRAGSIPRRRSDAGRRRRIGCRAPSFAPRFTFRPTRRFSPIIFRAGRYFRRRCCSTRRCGSRSTSRANRRR